MTTYTLDIILLFLLVISAVAAISVRSLLAASMFLAIYSLLMAQIWVHLQAVDVAFTEAAVGAGATTAFLVATISRTVRWEKK